MRAIDFDYENPYTRGAQTLLWLGLAYLASVYVPGLAYELGLGIVAYYVVLGVCFLAAVVSFARTLVGVLFLRDQRRRRREARTASGAFADAALATADKLSSWGMTEGPGLFLGLFDERSGLPIIHNPYAPGESHMATFALNRGGKTSGLVIPALLEFTGASIVVTDPKGELAPVTIRHRQTVLGQECIVLDPFGASGLPSAYFNPLDLLADDLHQNGGRRLGLYLDMVALQLVPDVPGDSNGNFFTQGARNIIIAGILYTLLFDPDNCNLSNVFSFVGRSPEQFHIAIQALRSSSRIELRAQESANMLEACISPEYLRTSGSFFEQARNALRLYSDPAMAEHTSISSFSVEDILNERTTIYLSVGSENVAYASKWMGLVVTLCMEALAKARGRHRVFFLLDEAGTIGRLPNLEDRLPQLPGKGLRVWLMLQSDQQLRNLYGEDQAKVILDNCSLWQGWGFRRKDMVEMFSFLAGKRTHKAKSFGTDSDDLKNFLSESHSEIEADVLPATALLHVQTRSEMYIYSLGRPMIRGFLMPFWRDFGWRRAASPNPIEGPPPADDPPRYSVSRKMR